MNSSRRRFDVVETHNDLGLFVETVNAMLAQGWTVSQPMFVMTEGFDVIYHQPMEKIVSVERSVAAPSEVTSCNTCGVQEQPSRSSSIPKLGSFGHYVKRLFAGREEAKQCGGHESVEMPMNVLTAGEFSNQKK